MVLHYGQDTSFSVCLKCAILVIPAIFSYFENIMSLESLLWPANLLTSPLLTKSCLINTHRLYPLCSEPLFVPHLTQVTYVVSFPAHCKLHKMMADTLLILFIAKCLLKYPLHSKICSMIKWNGLHGTHRNERWLLQELGITYSVLPAFWKAVLSSKHLP